MLSFSFLLENVTFCDIELKNNLPCYLYFLAKKYCIPLYDVHKFHTFLWLCLVPRSTAVEIVIVYLQYSTLQIKNTHKGTVGDGAGREGSENAHLPP